jgi:hypothetical protein
MEKLKERQNQRTGTQVQVNVEEERYVPQHDHQISMS